MALPFVPNLPDPLSTLPFAGARGFLDRRQQNPDAPILTPEEEEGLLGKALGGLEAVANVLDFPGALVRGVIHGGATGDWTRFPLPGEQYNRIYGRELLEDFGAPANREGMSEWFQPGGAAEFGYDLGGFGLELALDPLNMFTGPAKSIVGGATKGARAARTALKGVDDLVRVGTDDAMNAAVRQAGGYVSDVVGSPGIPAGPLTAKTPAGIAQEIRQGDRALMSIGLPGFLGWVAPGPRLNIGAGQEWAAKLYESLSYGRFSPSPLARALFTKHLEGVVNGRIQQEKDIAFEMARRYQAAVQDVAPVFAQRSRQLQEKFTALAAHAKKIGDHAGLQTYDQFSRYAADALQGAPERVAAMFGEGADSTKVREFAGAYHALFDTMRTLKDQLYAQVRELGLPGQTLDDWFVYHWPRRSSIGRRHAGFDEYARRTRLFSSATEISRRRLDVLRMWPGGTASENAIATDPIVAAVTLRGKGKKPHAPGSIVSTPTGPGRVIDSNKDFTYVHLESTGGMEVVQPFRTAEVGAATGTPTLHVPESLATIDDQQAAALRWLQAKVPDYVAPENAKPGDILDDYLFHRYAWPAYQMARDDSVKSLPWLAEAAAKAKRRGPDGKLVDAPMDLDDYMRTKLRTGWDKGELYPHLDEETGEFVLREATDHIPGAVGEMRRYVRHLPPDVLHTGLFDRNWVDDFATYMDDGLSALSNLRTMHQFLRGVVSQDAEGVPLKQLWFSMTRKGRDGKPRPQLTRKGLDTLVSDIVGEGKFGDPLEGLVPESADEVEQAMSDFVDSLHVPEETALMLQRYLDVPGPEGKNWLTQSWDAMTSLYKSYWTIPFPSFFTRNLTDTMWRLFAHAGPDTYNAKEFFPEFSRVADYLFNPTVKELDYLDEIKSLHIASGGRDRLADVLGPAAQEAKVPEAGGLLKSLSPLTWPGRPSRWRQRGLLNPFNIRGVRNPENWEADAPANFLMESGEQLFQSAEFLNRAPVYITLRRKGWTPSQAKEFTDRILFDYSDLSSFERRVARRLIPFYSWFKHNLPYQFSELLNAPGGRTAKTIRGINAAHRESDGYVPSFIRERAGFRIGGSPENATFVRSFGLSVEDLGNLAIGPGGVSRTLERYIAQTHPMISTAYEVSSGREPFSGRPIKYVEPITGDPTIDTVALASPLSRFFTEYEQLFSEKASRASRLVDFFIGSKFGTYDLEKWRLLAIQDAIEEQIQNIPEARKFETTYIPKDKRTSVTPGELRLLQAQQQANQRIIDLMAQRRREKAAQAPSS